MQPYHPRRPEVGGGSGEIDRVRPPTEPIAGFDDDDLTTLLDQCAGIGAAGALEAAAVLLSFEHALIPPTANTTVLDEGFEIDLVTGAARPWTPGPAMSNSLGFGYC
mgnify:CR=1 FL=1